MLQDTAQPEAPTAALAAVLGEVPRPVRRALAAWTVGTTVWAAGMKVKNWRDTHTTYRVSVEGTDELYPLIHDWLLGAIPPQRQRSLTVRTKTSRGDDTVAAETPLHGASDQPKPPHLSTFYDGSKPQYVTLKGHRVRVEVEREADNRFAGSSERAAAFFRALETIRLTAYSVGGRDAIVALLNEMQVELHTTEPKVRMFVASKWGDWMQRNGVRRRDLSTVVLAKGQLDAIVDDLDLFLRSSERYTELGLPHHRGYLLYGPPGTGKTSIVRALASHFGLALYILPLGDVGSDTNLLTLVSSLPRGAVLLLEDIDVAADAPRDRDTASDGEGGVSLSGLLNSLDGMTTPDGLIVVMTSNRRDVLDGALVRTGRVDVEVEVGHVDDDQLVRLSEYLTGEALPLRLIPALHGDVSAADVIETVKPHVLDPKAAKAALLRRFGR